uniref:Zinc metalloproteinase n=1 Tax=Haemonchus contortus TaxID=6289 RepID=A0A7I4XZZ4_HAECO
MLRWVAILSVLLCPAFCRPSLHSGIFERMARENEEELQKLHKLSIRKHSNQTQPPITRRPLVAEPSERNFKRLNHKFKKFLFDGDIIISHSLLREIVKESEQEYERSRIRRWAYRDFFYPETIWQTGVPYEFDEDLPDVARASLLEAMKFWQSNTCVTFRPRTNETQYVLFTGELDMCSSTVGRDLRQGQQLVYIGSGCYAFGVTTHEIGHVLGLFHHQQRYDRNEYVAFVQANVPESDWGDFETISSTFLDTYGLPYDVGSVMHYAPTEFARNAAFPSLLALNEELQGTMGNMEGPSFLDVEIINRHYQCSAICNRSNVEAPRCLNGGYTDPLNCTICKCPSGFGGSLCQEVASSAPLNCGRLLSATSKLTRLRVRMTIGPIRRQCVYHIRAPPNRRIMIGIQKVEGKCQEGCYTRAVEVKMNGDFRPVGYRYCCQSQSFRRLISKGRNVPVIFFAQNGTLDATLYFRWVVLTPDAEDATYLNATELMEVYKLTDSYGMDMEVLQLPEGSGMGTPGGTLGDNVFEGEANDSRFEGQTRRAEDGGRPQSVTS